MFHPFLNNFTVSRLFRTNMALCFSMIDEPTLFLLGIIWLEQKVAPGTGHTKPRPLKFKINGNDPRYNVLDILECQPS